jgi:hypothetical protein
MVLLYQTALFNKKIIHTGNYQLNTVWYRACPKLINVTPVIKFTPFDDSINSRRAAESRCGPLDSGQTDDFPVPLMWNGIPISAL